MNRYRISSFRGQGTIIGLLLGLLVARALYAAEGAVGLSEHAVVERAVAGNPTLQMALLQVAQAEEQVRAEEGLYSPILSASGGYTHNRNPNVRGISASDVFDLGVGLRVPFAIGTVFDASIDGARTTGSSSAGTIPVGGTGSIVAGGGAFGPWYTLSGRLAVVQPLLRGAGSSIGRASLRQAKLRKTASESAAEATANSLLSEVLRAYWELWYADRAIAINEAARDLAAEQSRQAEASVKSGALAQADALVYITRTAELEEAVVLSKVERQQRSLALALLLADTGGQSTELTTTDSPPEPTSGAPDTAVVLADAERASPELRQLEANIQLAADQAKIAGDSLRPRLDIDAFVAAQGFGDEKVSPALEQVGKFEAVSAGVGLTFEAPLDGTRRRAQISNAKLSQHIAEKQLEATRLQIQSDVRRAIAARDAAEQRVRLATETARVARVQAEAERRRFLAGASIAINVQVAENSLRQAELRVERARVDWTLAELTLATLRGRLLERYRTLARAKPPVPNVGGLIKSVF